MSGHRQLFEHWVPFSIPDGRHIVVQALINGRATEVIIDSAAGNLVLSANLSARLGLQSRGNVVGVGVTGHTVGSITKAPEIKIGDITIHPQIANIFDLSPFNVVAGREISAVIGRDLFAKHVVEIDFERNMLAILPQSDWAKFEDWSQVPLTFEQPGNRAVPLSVDNREPVKAVFDLGSDTPLYLSASYSDSHHLLEGKRQSTSMSVGVEGMKLNKIAVLDLIQIGSYSVKNVPVEIPQQWMSSAPAVVGLPVLQRFHLAVNFSKDLLALRPIKSVIGSPFRKDRSGIGAGRDGDNLRIMYVVPNSPASLAGLKVGDIICAINGRKLDSSYFKARPHEGSKPAGTLLRLDLTSGKSIDLRLQDYY